MSFQKSGSSKLSELVGYKFTFRFNISLKLLKKFSVIDTSYNFFVSYLSLPPSPTKIKP